MESIQQSKEQHLLNLEHRYGAHDYHPLPSQTIRLEVLRQDGKMVIVLNKNEYKVYESIHIKRWDIFENYFKAGNYFQSRDEGSFSKVSFYELEVSHD